MANCENVLIVGHDVLAFSTALALSSRRPTTQIVVVSPNVPFKGQQARLGGDLRLLRNGYHPEIKPDLVTQTHRVLCQDQDFRNFVYRRGEICALMRGDVKGERIMDEMKTAIGPEASKGIPKLLSYTEAIRGKLPPSTPATIQNSEMPDSCWQEAIFDPSSAMVDMLQLLSILHRRCQSRSNITFQFGDELDGPIVKSNVFEGLRLSDGSEIRASTAVVTDALLSQKWFGDSLSYTAVGYDVAWLQPSDSLVTKYKDMPVLSNLSTGFTIFPPIDGAFKCTLEMNKYGHLDASNNDSFAWLLSSSVEREIRRNMADILPELADQPLVRPRLAWNVTPDKRQSTIYRVPQCSGLIVATLPSIIEPQGVVLGSKLVEEIDQVALLDMSHKLNLAENPPITDDLAFHKPIVIVGAGVFGLTTAFHLARRGYKNVTLLDREPYDQTGYSSHAASADRNKIIRASYGPQKLYEDLAFKALDTWEQWNARVRSESELPEFVSSNDLLWDNCGFLRAGELTGLDPEETATQDSFPEALKDTQYRLSDDSRKKDAQLNGVSQAKLDPFDRSRRGLGMDGIFDATGGYVSADKSCSWVLHLCQKLGVRTRLGKQYAFRDFDRMNSKIIGVKTGETGILFPADLVIVAAGGWTPSIVPQVADLLQTTAGSVLKIQLPPQNERPDLWKKYHSSEFPCWSWRLTGSTLQGTEVGGIYGFPRTQDGLIKIGFRGTKWSNLAYSNAEGRLVSYPDTNATGLPTKAMSKIREFCKENMPDLVGLPLSTRLCWYTDSVDSNFLIDRVPGSEGLMVASGGSGHAFKFLPVLGEHVVDLVERKVTGYTDLFKWRDPSTTGEQAPFNAPSEKWPALCRDDMSCSWN